jgi:hypothetical protein
VIGAEDIEVDFKTGIAYLSTADHRGMSFLLHTVHTSIHSFFSRFEKNSFVFI